MKDEAIERPKYEEEQESRTKALKAEIASARQSIERIEAEIATKQRELDAREAGLAMFRKANTPALSRDEVEAKVLASLDSFPDGGRPSTIARKCGIDAAIVQGALGRLFTSGAVVKLDRGVYRRAGVKP